MPKPNGMLMEQRYTPARVAPLEFTLPRADYLDMGGHADSIRTLDQSVTEGGEYPTEARVEPWPQQ